MIELNLVQLIFFWYLLRRNLKFIIFSAEHWVKLLGFLLLFFLMLSLLWWRARFILRITRWALTIFQFFAHYAEPLTIIFIWRRWETQLLIFIKNVTVIVVNRKLIELRRPFVLEFLVPTFLLKVYNAGVPVLSISFEILNFNLRQLHTFCSHRCHERNAVIFRNLCLLYFWRWVLICSCASFVKLFSAYILLF